MAPGYAVRMRRASSIRTASHGTTPTARHTGRDGELCWDRLTSLDPSRVARNVSHLSLSGIETNAATRPLLSSAS